MLDRLTTAQAETATIGTPVEAANYIRDLAAELATMARQANLKTLAYILDMAAMEAAANAGTKPPRGGPANPAQPRR
jgi:hypothetical protein